MTNHVPERTCIVCRKKGDKSNFVKFVKNKNGKVLMQKDVLLFGRGAYICNNETCLAKAKKSHVLSKVFKCNVSDDVFENGV